MDGQKLYEIWSDAMMNQGVGVDPWPDLADADKVAWGVAAQATKTSTDDYYDGPDING